MWHKNNDLGGLTTEDCIIIPGGFSYGDYMRSGAIARFSPIMESVIEFANAGGLVFGICNGFQILCEAGLLPGTLLRNRDKRFIAKNIHLRIEHNQSLLTNQLKEGEVLKIPIAHAEGRYYAEEKVLDTLEQNGQVLFRYCEPGGELTEAANVNGSARNIAGISNEQGNIFGMMPHPERASEMLLGNDDGLKIFESLMQSEPVRAN